MLRWVAQWGVQVEILPAVWPLALATRGQAVCVSSRGLLWRLPSIHHSCLPACPQLDDAAGSLYTGSPIVPDLLLQSGLLCTPSLMNTQPSWDGSLCANITTAHECRPSLLPCPECCSACTRMANVGLQQNQALPHTSTGRLLACRWMERWVASWRMLSLSMALWWTRT